MKKSAVAFTLVAMLVLLALPVFAGSIDTTDQITLAASPANSFVFTGLGPTGNFSLSLVNVLGAASGIGTLASSGFYSIAMNGSSLASGGSCGVGCFLINQSKPLLLAYGSNYTNGSLLTGALQLLSIDQSSSGKSGVFNDSLLVNLTVTGGSLATHFSGSSGVVQLTLLFGTTQELATIMKGQHLYASIHSGAVNPLTLPEPASLALVGSGLLSLGGVISILRLAKRRSLNC